MFASLAVRNYRLFATGQVVSLTGTWMQRVAQDWLVLELTHANGTALGIVTALQFLPMLLFGLYGGLLADRYDKRKLLIGANIAMGVIALVLGVLDTTGVVRLWQVYVLAFLLGLASVFDTPVRHAFVADLVDKEALPNAVGLNSATFNSSRIVGPALAGLMINAVGTGPVFMTNAASTIYVLVNLLRMRPEEMQVHRAVVRAKGQLKAGLSYVRRTPDLLYTLLLVFMVGTFGFNFQITMALMAKLAFHRGAGSYGVLSAVFATGSLVGALLAARRPKPSRRVFVVGAVMFGLLEVVVGVMPTYAAFAFALLPCGLAALTFTTSANTHIQLTADPLMRGRVMALYVLVFLGGTPVGAPVIGYVSNAYGPRWSLVVGGVVCSLSGLVIGLALLKAHRRTVRGQGPNRLVELTDETPYDAIALA